jgi:hypothetical protein
MPCTITVGRIRFIDWRFLIWLNFREIMEQSFPDCCEYYESTCMTNMHLSQTDMLVSIVIISCARE